MAVFIACSLSPISYLGRDTSVNPLIESTLLRKLGGKVLLVLFEHLLVILGQAFNLVNVRNLDSWARETKKNKVVVSKTGCSNNVMQSYHNNELIIHTESYGPLLAILPAAEGYMPGNCM